MAVSTIEELFAVLGPDSSAWPKIVGTAEAGWIEFKRAPYRLAEHRQKLELAKDISAIANYGSGVLVIGVQTERDASTASDVAASISPVRLAMVDCDQIRKIIQRYVYPHLEVSCKVWPLDDEERLALVSLFVERQDEGEKYFIVTEGVSQEGDEVLANHIGVFVRQADGDIVGLQPSYLHDLIREGRRARRAVDQRRTYDLPLLELLVGRDRGRAAETQVDVVEPAELGERLTDDVEAAGVEDTSYLFLQAWPESPSEIRDLLDRRQAGFYPEFIDPSSLRPRGFNLGFGTSAEVLPGGALRKIRPGGLSLSVRADGLTTMVVGSYFLGWAMEQTSSPYRMNPLTLIELVTEFCRFFSGPVLGRTETAAPLRGRFWAGFRQLSRQGVSELPEGDPDVRGRRAIWGQSHELVGERTEIDVRVEGAGDAAGTAFELLRRIYREFGIDESSIPYTDAERRRVLFQSIVDA